MISNYNILLNATQIEINELGGDFSLYGDWLRLSGNGLSFRLVPSHPVRRLGSVVRKALEKLCRTWEPVALRRRLFLLSRFLWVPSQALDGTDLVFSHLLFPWAPSRKVPIIWSSQGISPAAYYERYNRGQWTVEDVAFVFRVLGRKAAALVIPTETCARNLVRLCPELEGKIRIVPAPVFVDHDGAIRKPSEDDGRIRLLFVGVDAVLKGLPEVGRAFRILKTRYEHLYLEVVSRPHPEFRRQMEILRDIQLHPPLSRAHVKALMGRADIFVLPTRADTYALAAVEAMAHGCAVVISDLEPLPEIIPPGEVGFAVPSGNVDALVEKLELLITNNDLLRRFQECARQRYLRYHSPDVVAGKLRAVFEQVLGT